MSYYINADHVALSDLQKRIEATDLVPSRAALLKDIQRKFQKLSAQEIKTLADLRKQMKTAQQISAFSGRVGIDEEYLALLRREIESYFPKAFPLSAFNWLPAKECKKLEEAGYKNAQKLYDALGSLQQRKLIGNDLQIDISTLATIFCLVDLTRVQWISPLFARMMASAGYDSPQEIAKADAEELCNSVDTKNKENKYFKGKIGLRDIKRVIHAAQYVK